MAFLRRETSHPGKRFERAASTSPSWKTPSAPAVEPLPASLVADCASPGKTDPDGGGARPRSARGGSSSSTARKRVLIIEDDHTHASALRSILTRKGYEVAAAMTVAEGIAMLASRPDYIVLDLMLPDGDGVDVLKRVRELECTAGAPRVVVATAVTDPARIREVLALQPHRLLKKPIDLVDLLSAIGMI